jgi:hypothetical protein
VRKALSRRTAPAMGDWSSGFASMVEFVEATPELSSLIEEVDLAESTTSVDGSMGWRS